MRGQSVEDCTEEALEENGIVYQDALQGGDYLLIPVWGPSAWLPWALSLGGAILLVITTFYFWKKERKMSKTSDMLRQAADMHEQELGDAENRATTAEGKAIEAQQAAEVAAKDARRAAAHRDNIIAAAKNLHATKERADGLRQQARDSLDGATKQLHEAVHAPPALDDEEEAKPA
jgi:hypothetical protein